MPKCKTCKYWKESRLGDGYCSNRDAFDKINIDVDCDDALESGTELTDAKFIALKWWYYGETRKSVLDDIEAFRNWIEEKRREEKEHE